MARLLCPGSTAPTLRLEPPDANASSGERRAKKDRQMHREREKKREQKKKTAAGSGRERGMAE